jgi:hypothetical protein
MVAQDWLRRAETRKAKFGSAVAESIGWLGVSLLCLVFWRLAQERGYWVWKDNPTLIGFGLDFGVMLAGCLLPFLLLISPFLIWKKKVGAEYVRMIQVLLPIASLVFGVMLMDEARHRSVDFRLYAEGRHRVVEAMRQQPKGESSLVKINEPHVAANDEVWLYREGVEHMVFFPVLIEGLDNYKGFVYSETGTEPPRSAFLEIVSVKRIDPHWFWIGTT